MRISLPLPDGCNSLAVAAFASRRPYRTFEGNGWGVRAEYNPVAAPVPPPLGQRMREVILQVQGEPSETIEAETIDCGDPDCAFCSEFRASDGRRHIHG